MNERAFQHASGRMFEGLGKSLKNREVGRTFEIESPALEFGLVILVKADVRECFEDLLAAVVNAMGRADESNDDIAVCGFVEDDFGMAGGDDLRALAGGHVGQQLINLALAEDFKMCIGFVEQENRLWDSRKDEQATEVSVASHVRRTKGQADSLPGLDRPW